MVEYTSDICRVDSSSLFKPINNSNFSGGMVDALNLEFSFLLQEDKSSILFWGKSK